MAALRLAMPPDTAHKKAKQVAQMRSALRLPGSKSLEANALTPRDETSYPVFGLRANLLRNVSIPSAAAGWQESILRLGEILRFYGNVRNYKRLC